MIGPRIGRMLCPWLFAPLAQLEAAAGAGRLGHGWLISGPAGIGKRNLAYVIADRLLAGAIGSPPPEPATPRGMLAANAELATADLHPDLHRLRAEEDKRTISVNQVRDATAALTLTPHLAACKLVIIDRADIMTPEAANALLKSLEEPTPATYLFLLADRPGRLPPTVLSRCQRLTLRLPPAEHVEAWLAADGLDPAPLALRPRPLTPLVAAQLLNDDGLFKIYIELQDSIDLVYDAKVDPHALAERWQKGDTELALSCLIERLQAEIRERLVPGHSKLITDRVARLTENPPESIAADALFAGLRLAENLREQLGRGTNVELALKSLLLGLERSHPERMNW